MTRVFSFKHWVKIGGLLFLSWFIIHQTVVISDGLIDDPGSTNYLVIFGNTVNEDGTLSPRLKARLDKGIEIYSSKKTMSIFVSGGLGKEGHLEGSKMAEYLILQGVPAAKITIDNNGNNSRSSAINFKKVFPNAESVMLVSQYHHVARAKLAFRQIGYSDVNATHCDYFELRDFYSCFREFFGYYGYLLRY